MPKTIEQISILISHTGEMTEHANLVRNKIENMNKFLIGDGYSLLPKSWKRDIASGHGTDGQDVVNSQFLETTDIVIALFGSKAGTPTKRAASGTAEELYAVKNQANSPFGKHNAQVYFHNKLILMSEIVPEEIDALISLKEKLKEDGFLVVDYSTDHEMLDLIENGVRQALKTYGEGTPFQGALIKTDTTKDQQTDETPGLLDDLEDLQKTMGKAVIVMENSSILLNEFSPKLQSITANLPAAHSTTDRKHLIDSAATLMSELADPLDDCGTQLTDQFDQAKVSIFNIIDIIDEDLAHKTSKDDLEELETILLGTTAAASTAVRSMDHFRDSILSTPRMTSQMNKAKNKLIQAVEKNSTAISSFLAVTQQAANKVRSMIDKS